MAPSPPRLRILSVGGNAVSAFLSWRLQATNSCDVTLVWKSGFESVAQYGVSFKSKQFGNERFKPRHVVRSPEEASSRENAYDYVILCVKALPDVYDLAAVIESVVTPQHTCILVNTTNTLGVEAHLEQRFPTNVVLSLVSGLEITQIGASEFEHTGSTEIWVGPANKNPSIPASIQNDMAVALAITLGTGQVDCKVSKNIRQEQFEHMVGPIAFHPASVLFDTPNHAQLLEKVGVRQMVSDVIDELIELAKAQGCSFPDNFREKTIGSMTAPSDTQSIMYQDFVARRPMEVETYLGSAVKLATELSVRVPRIETLYAMLHHVNIVNQTRPQKTEPSPPVLAQPPPRMSSVPPQSGMPPLRPPMNGAMRSSRTTTGMAMMPPPRRGPPPMAGPPRAPNGQPGRLPRDPSFEDSGLEEFSHLVLYDDLPDGAIPQNGGGPYPDAAGGSASAADIAMRERELALRQRELQLREQELHMRRGPPGPRRAPPSRPAPNFDEDDEDDYFDPLDTRMVPQIDPDNFDMMSVTSRRTRKAPSASQLRKNPEMMASNGGRPGSSFSRYFGGSKNRTSARIMQDMPGVHENLLDNPMMMYASNRYGAVDRKQMHVESRANSLTVSRAGDYGPGPYPPSRRTSQSPGTPFGGMGGRGMPRPPPPQDHPSFGPPNGMPQGRPSPPGGIPAPVPRYPPGQGNAVGPQQVEQNLGVSNSYPAKGSPNNSSLTGSASASAESGDSGASANIDSENSAHSSQTSLGGQQAPMPVR
ncbi:hypothetical protein DTO164E3_735 [Paecilomyces variotii]|nr:hypothetical protein DTO164E3_735 [Paecilomyces variotii]KAJ9362899.1 hypothetical protein DTO280E4_3248 [Paecilomyces variotii]KAJ9400831.1 hypothetical protein DTO282F9_2399 [Paecilomyces variotii]KAJ9406288.1 hypothetical protein DTO045G8_5924 [Paecilomyces variotii]